jgi:tetratricopeptide (TPR) repeat protein
MYNRALEGKEEALGLKHISTLNTVNNLGNLYADQGKLAEAEAMYNQALQGLEEALGPKHTLILNMVNNLGLLYTDQGRLAEAEAMYSQALQGYENALGLILVSSYIPALNTIFNLGNFYLVTGQTDKAKAMYTQALTGYTTVQGASSDICEYLRDRLQALQLGSAKSETHQNASIETRAQRLKSLMQKIFHKHKR